MSTNREASSSSSSSSSSSDDEAAPGPPKSGTSRAGPPSSKQAAHSAGVLGTNSSVDRVAGSGASVPSSGPPHAADSGASLGTANSVASSALLTGATSGPTPGAGMANNVASSAPLTGATSGPTPTRATGPRSMQTSRATSLEAAPQRPEQPVPEARPCGFGSVGSAGVEKFSQLKIAERCLRTDRWETLMTGKSYVPFDRVGQVSALDVDAKDSVMIGVVYAKTCARTSSNGNNYGHWMMTDLAFPQPRIIDLLLHGESFETWEKNPEVPLTIGCVVAILNPTPFEGNPETPKAGDGKRLSVKINYGSQVVKLGISPSLAICRCRKKDGMPCSMPCDKERGGTVCYFHSMSEAAKKANQWKNKNASGGGGGGQDGGQFSSQRPRSSDIMVLCAPRAKAQGTPQGPNQSLSVPRTGTGTGRPAALPTQPKKESQEEAAMRRMLCQPAPQRRTGSVGSSNRGPSTTSSAGSVMGSVPASMSAAISGNTAPSGGRSGSVGSSNRGPSATTSAGSVMGSVPTSMSAAISGNTAPSGSAGGSNRGPSTTTSVGSAVGSVPRSMSAATSGNTGPSGGNTGSAGGSNRGPSTTTSVGSAVGSVPTSMSAATSGNTAPSGGHATPRGSGTRVEQLVGLTSITRVPAASGDRPQASPARGTSTHEEIVAPPDYKAVSAPKSKGTDASERTKLALLRMKKMFPEGFAAPNPNDSLAASMAAPKEVVKASQEPSLGGLLANLNLKTKPNECKRGLPTIPKTPESSARKQEGLPTLLQVGSSSEKSKRGKKRGAEVLESQFGSRVAAQLAALDPKKDLVRKQSSRFQSLVEDEQQAKRHARLNELEAQDAMIEKAEAMVEMNVTAWRCRTCEITTDSQRGKAHCEEAGHDVVKMQVKKTRWVCSGCRCAHTVLDRNIPKQCMKCKGTEFKQVALQAAKVALMEKDQLLARGEEMKFLNSAPTNAEMRLKTASEGGNPGSKEEKTDYSGMEISW